MVELQSDKNQSDRYRMLPQSACLARLERKICDCPFIQLSTLPQSARVLYKLYIENSGRVTRYFLFQHDDDSEVCTFQSKQSESCNFSVVLVGFLCLGRPTPDSRVLSMTYLAHFPSLSYWVRPELPALAMAEKHTTGNLRQLMREQVGTYDVKLEDIYGMVARTNQCTFRHASFLIAVERCDSLASKPSRMTGCGSLTRKPFSIFCKFRVTIS